MCDFNVITIAHAQRMPKIKPGRFHTVRFGEKVNHFWGRGKTQFLECCIVLFTKQNIDVCFLFVQKVMRSHCLELFPPEAQVLHSARAFMSVALTAVLSPGFKNSGFLSCNLNVETGAFR